jgi:hypothetical protein
MDDACWHMERYPRGSALVRLLERSIRPSVEPALEAAGVSDRRLDDDQQSVGVSVLTAAVREERQRRFSFKEAASTLGIG